MNSLTWYRICFHNTMVQFDLPSKEGRSEHQGRLDCDALLLSAIENNLEDQPGLIDIIVNMFDKGVIKGIEMIANSAYFGPGILRCSYIFPSEIYIPTSHNLKSGLIQKTRTDGMVSYKGDMYMASVSFEIGISNISPEDIETLRSYKSPKFIGLMDSVQLKDTGKQGKEKMHLNSSKSS
nr:TPA_asm: M [Pogostemom alphacytorhabdovirus 1_Sol]